MEEILVPIFVCVVLPVSIVLILALTKINGENKLTKVIIKSIESNNDFDTNKLVETLKKSRKSPREILNLRLLRGCIFSLLGVVLMIFGLYLQLSDNAWDYCYLLGGASLAIGIGYIIVYYVTRNQPEVSESK